VRLIPEPETPCIWNLFERLTKFLIFQFVGWALPTNQWQCKAIFNETSSDERIGVHGWIGARSGS
jgi:hypothetical protein